MTEFAKTPTAQAPASRAPEAQGVTALATAPVACSPVTPCFTPGALIATPRGEVPVESLRPGDKVITRDTGVQEIRWVGSRTLSRAQLAEMPSLKPVLVKAGALGFGLPERDMLVSPQHRVMVAGSMVRANLDEAEVFVKARDLVNHGTIRMVETLRTTYIHLLFDRHELVMSNGSWTESFQPTQEVLDAMAQDTRAEILALFPELAEPGAEGSHAPARRSLTGAEAAFLRP